MLLCLGKGGRNLFLLCDSDSICTVAFCQLHEIRYIGWTGFIGSFAVCRTTGSPSQTGGTVTLSVKQFLHLPYHSKIVIVKQADGNGSSIGYRSGHLLNVHLKSAVTGNADYILIRIGKLGTDCRRKTKAHGAKAPGGEKLTSSVQL